VRVSACVGAVARQMISVDYFYICLAKGVIRTWWPGAIHDLTQIFSFMQFYSVRTHRGLVP